MDYVWRKRTSVHTEKGKNNMGIYMPNIEKPKQCAGCQFEVIDTTGYPRCVVMRKMVVDGNLFNRCPLVEIPTPHGRLIDADLFKEIIKDSVPAWTIGVKIPTYGDMDIMDKIYFIPTILEAEP